MTVEVYIAVLLTIVVVAIGVAVTALVMVLIQLRRTARATEFLLIRLEEHLNRVGEKAGDLGQIVVGLASLVGKKTVLGAGVVYSLFRLITNRFSKPPKEDDR